MHARTLTRPARRVRWARWTLACTAGELLGIAVAATMAVLLIRYGGEPETYAARFGVLAVMTLAGALEGVALGSFQWVVLRRSVPSVPARAWIGVTLGIAAFGWLLGIIPPLFLFDASAGVPPPEVPDVWVLVGGAALLGLGLGALLGGAQALVLRRHSEGALAWTVANAIGWAVGMAVLFGIAGLVPAGAGPVLGLVYGAAGGICSGVAVGSVTGLVLVRLQTRRDPI